MSGNVTKPKVIKAVQMTRNKDCNPGDLITERNPPVHGKLPGHRRELFGNPVTTYQKTLQLPFDPDKKDRSINICMLIRINNIAPATINKISDNGGYSFLIRARSQKYRVCHAKNPQYTKRSMNKKL
jgi:hypothetical protein